MLLSSCTRSMFPGDMFKVKDASQYAPVEELFARTAVKVVAGDDLHITVMSNKGESLLNPLSAASGALDQQTAPVVFTVDPEGFVFLPLAGKVQVAGLSTPEIEAKLAELYAKNMVEPFIQVRVANKRAYFITGNQNQKAVAVPLTHANTSLMDVIAAGGGIMEGKASFIKLIRFSSGVEKVYRIDLSQYRNASLVNIQIQPGDIVYVEPSHRALKSFVQEFTPYLTIISTALLIYNITR